MPPRAKPSGAFPVCRLAYPVPVAPVVMMVARSRVTMMHSRSQASQTASPQVDASFHPLLEPKQRYCERGPKPGGRATARYQDIACDEIVVPIPTYEKISGPGAKSGADQDDRCRHRQSHGERAANRQDECGKQIYLRPQAVYRHASHSTNRKARKPSPGRSSNGFLARAHCVQKPRATGA